MKYAVLVLCLLTAVSCMCKTDIEERVSNSDGSYQATVSTENCGATTGIVTTVSVARKYLGFFSGAPGEVFSVETPYPISVTWVDARHVQVEYRRGHTPPGFNTLIKIGTKKDAVGPVRVTYRAVDRITPTDLEEAAATLRRAILDRNTHRVLMLMSDKGVELSSDRATFESIKADFYGHGSMYCALFDGDCLRANDRSQRTKAGAPERSTPLQSVFELLSEPATRVEVRDGGSGVGTIRVVAPSRLDQPACDLAMTLQEEGWKIASIPKW